MSARGSIKSRVERMEKAAESLNLKSRVKFFSSYDEYKQALQRESIRENDICFIENVPEVDESELETIHHIY